MMVIWIRYVDELLRGLLLFSSWLEFEVLVGMVFSKMLNIFMFFCCVYKDILMSVIGSKICDISVFIIIMDKLFN